MTPNISKFWFQQKLIRIIGAIILNVVSKTRILFLGCTVYNRELCAIVFPSTNIYLQMPDVFEACPGAENNPRESECLGYV